MPLAESAFAVWVPLRGGRGGGRGLQRLYLCFLGNKKIIITLNSRINDGIIIHIDILFNIVVMLLYYCTSVQL